ncbi:hypothetical protein, partial [Erwinia amylovora]|uniref:hypothetical protein n=1 Tax=Erwinia amylovora TaxID=552 RepID=UPI0020C17189
SATCNPYQTIAQPAPTGQTHRKAHPQTATKQPQKADSNPKQSPKKKHIQAIPKQYPITRRQQP